MLDRLIAESRDHYSSCNFQVVDFSRKRFLFRFSNVDLAG